MLIETITGTKLWGKCGGLGVWDFFPNTTIFLGPPFQLLAVKPTLGIIRTEVAQT